MTSAELSSDLQHHKVQNSEPLQEHAGIYRRFFLPVYLNRNMWIMLYNNKLLHCLTPRCNDGG